MAELMSGLNLYILQVKATIITSFLLCFCLDSGFQLSGKGRWERKEIITFTQPSQKPVKHNNNNKGLSTYVVLEALN